MIVIDNDALILLTLEFHLFDDIIICFTLYNYLLRLRTLFVVQMQVSQLAACFAKGFEIYGVSLDTDLTRWENTIGEQGMNWINVAQKKGGGFDPTALYAVSSIPANFLISPEGKIVAKNLRGEHLEEKLAEVLK